MVMKNAGLIAIAIIAAGYLMRSGQGGLLRAEAMGGAGGGGNVNTNIYAPVTTTTYAPTNISYGAGGTTGPDRFNDVSVEDIILGRAAEMGDFPPSPFHRQSGGVGGMWR